MDLNDLATVSAFAEEYKAKGQPLHVLINNAGIMNTPFAMTKDGYDLQLVTTH